MSRFSGSAASNSLMPSPPADISHTDSNLKSSHNQQHQHPPHSFHQTPASPPLSVATSTVDSAGNHSPFATNAAFTPPSSTPMSANPSSTDPSQLPQPHPSLPPRPDVGAPDVTEPTTSTTITTTLEPSNELRPKSALGKRKSEASEDVAPLKRVRLDDQPQAQDDGEVVMMEAESAVVEEDPAVEKMDTSPLYKLCQKSVSQSRPHPTNDLFSLYSLQPIAATVARKDPATGEKINKLRKSYANHIKDVAGRNEPQATPDIFMNLLNWPEEEYYNQRIHGKALKDGLQSDIMAKLDMAVKMAPGKLPAQQDAQWRNVLGLEDPVAKPTVPQQTQQPTKIAAPKAATPYQAKSSTPLSAGEPPRPKRRGTKRRYDDDSFEGYGETFEEDNTDSVISLNDDDDGRRGSGSKRKRRRETATSPAFASTMSPFTQNAVSVGSGSGR